MSPTAVPTTVPSGEAVTIDASDPRLKIVGRHRFNDQGEMMFDWSAVTIAAAFSGPSITLLLEDGGNLYDVSIDDQTTILATDPEQSSYTLAEDLPPGPHLLRLTKRTEAYVGAATFSGFILAGGYDLLSRPKSKERKIEFIGDSITAGYGIEGDSPTCWFTPGTENVAKTYAALTADHFEAEYSVVALSGIGVLRNLRESDSSSSPTAIDYLHRSLAMDAVPNWNSANWAADAVVINLGTNDFSSMPQPEVEAFVPAYVDLLIEVRQEYPAAHLFALSGPLMFGHAAVAIETAVQRMQQETEDRRVDYVQIDNTLDAAGADFGCDWHPNVEGHKKIAAQLIPAIAAEMGW